MHSVWKTNAVRMLVTCSCLSATGCGTPLASMADRQQRKAEAAVSMRLAAQGVTLPEAVHPPATARFADPSPMVSAPVAPPDAGQGEPPQSESWLRALPQEADGTVRLDRAAAVLAALMNSPDFQREREDLFLSAQDLTVEEHKFELQGGLTSSGSRLSEAGTLNGDRPAKGAVESSAAISKMTRNGGRFLLDLANSVLVNLGGGPDKVVRSAIDLSVVQPLLRYGSRKYVMEDLTQAQRNLVANVRRLEQFRRGFYIRTTAGRSVAEGPLRGAGEAQDTGLLAGPPGGNSGAQEPGGFLGLLLSEQKIRNQEAVLQALQDSLAQLESAFEAGRITNRLQVLQTRQALYNSQSRLLTARESWHTQLDSYKISLGLPPGLPVSIHDPLLEQSQLVDPDTTALQNDVTAKLNTLRQRKDLGTVAAVSAEAQAMLQFKPRVDSRLVVAARDLTGFLQELKPRQAQLTQLTRRKQVSGMGTVVEIFDPAVTGETGQRLEKTFPILKKGLEDNFAELEALRNPDAATPHEPEQSRSDLQRVVSGISGQLLELSLHQAACRLETATLENVDLPPQTGLELARTQRLDWANAQSRLVDAWRKIAVSAEALKPGLDLLVSGRIPTVGNDGTDFQGREGTLNVGLSLDVPWDKVDERSAYQESLIGYQRARRDYIHFCDGTTLSLQNTLRLISLIQVNFEIRRAAVRAAISQVDLARLRLNEPPKPDQAGAQFGATTARDLVSALDDLLEAQNDFQSAWITYDVLRLILDFELGTMRLDDRGLWLDPGAITSETVRRLPAGPALTSVN